MPKNMASRGGLVGGGGAGGKKILAVKGWSSKEIFQVLQ